MSERRPVRPRARQDGLLIEELSDETLVYDLENHEAHCLNEVAARVWRSADGGRSVSELARDVEEGLGRPVGEDAVWLALEHLEGARLLQDSGEELPEPPYSRRDVVKKLAALGVLPAIMSIPSPTAAQAATRITNQDCMRDPQRFLGRCCTNNKTCVISGKSGQAKCQGPPC